MANPQDWRTRVIGALGAVLAVALVIGGVVGAVAYGAAKVTGLTGGDPLARNTQAAAPASVSQPASPSPSASSSPSHSPSKHASRHPAAKPASTTRTKVAKPTPSHSPTPKPKPKPKHHKAHHRTHAASGTLTLTASRHHVGHMGRIDLSGHYRGHDGATLDVQQRVGGGHWSGFPVTAQVRGGSFHTWVESGRRGPNQFRVVDPATGAASDAVTVVVG